jgi:hypothetical protein
MIVESPGRTGAPLALTERFSQTQRSKVSQTAPPDRGVFFVPMALVL